MDQEKQYISINDPQANQNIIIKTSIAEELNIAHGLFSNSPVNRGAGAGFMNNDLLSDLHTKDELVFNINKAKRKSKTGRTDRDRTPTHGGAKFDKTDE